MLSVDDDELELALDTSDESLAELLMLCACNRDDCNMALIIWNAVAKSFALSVVEDVEVDEVEVAEDEEDEVDAESVNTLLV
ncbi:hypothetical protein [Telmatospirillum siberiense]|uniref:Uncharacterized protein n=1 Tax=Telmatospirillum siberiense TaxID=382514 RepID=A0A2N3PVE1_9PROT|nr:hypothetical protein [Telmatospirillum siberiense]PKU24373.1 hypothetical protein CWS72_12345 [Telmatospirillum siberiense]